MDDQLIFLGLGGAGNIKKRAPHAQVRGSLLEHDPLHGGKTGQILGLAAPPQFRMAAEHPQTGTGGIDEDAVETVTRFKRQRGDGICQEEINAVQAQALKVLTKSTRTALTVIHSQDVSLAMQKLGQMGSFITPASAYFQYVLSGSGLQQERSQLGGLILEEPEASLIRRYIKRGLVQGQNC